MYKSDMDRTNTQIISNNFSSTTTFKSINSIYWRWNHAVHLNQCWFLRNQSGRYPMAYSVEFIQFKLKLFLFKLSSLNHYGPDEGRYSMICDEEHRPFHILPFIPFIYHHFQTLITTKTQESYRTFVQTKVKSTQIL